uniref:Uncharacterized protein n=1 Tax=Physcomitrium patens TaxID=3218 RepID=A0A2K1JTY9_PHYPA|nr:hypothetical protein PHYPA_014763 [Physcomitrium patens]
MNSNEKSICSVVGCKIIQVYSIINRKPAKDAFFSHLKNWSFFKYGIAYMEKLSILMSPTLAEFLGFRALT